jgi:Spy/CpxP family protein refolding chaperone
MHKLTRTLALAALGTCALMAQRGTPPDPATMVQHRVARLTTLLTLTTAQASQATTIFTNAQTAITPLHTSLEQYRDSMQTAVKGNALGTIDSLAASTGTVEGQILGIQAKADAAFYALLTAEQKTKYDSMPQGRGPGGRGMRPMGGPGGPGGPGMQGMGRGRGQ